MGGSKGESTSFQLWYSSFGNEVQVVVGMA